MVIIEDNHAEIHILLIFECNVGKIPRSGLSKASERYHEYGVGD